MKNNIKIIIFITIIIVISLFPSEANAQEQRTITIVPPTVQKTLNPNDKVEGTMKVINDSDEPITFNVAVQDFIVADNQGTPNLLSPNTLNKKFSAAAWVGVLPGTFTLAPRQKQMLSYYIQIPPDARPGGHYAAVTYTPVNPEGVSGSGASIETKVGTLFYITINGAVSQSSFVTKFFTNAFQEYGPVKIETQVKNFGDLHVRPTGKITVTDILGRTVELSSLEELNIFPTAARDYVNIVGKTLMIGPFTAKLVASYGKNNNLPLIASVSFWVFPWRITLVIVLIVIALVLGWKLWKKRGTNTQKDANKESEQSPKTS